jgi:hypothetical protein
MQPTVPEKTDNPITTTGKCPRMYPDKAWAWSPAIWPDTCGESNPHMVHSKSTLFLQGNNGTGFR